MVKKIHRISKAVGAAAPGLALLVGNLATEVTGVTEDGIVDVSEWYLLAFSVVAALGAFFAPKNALPA